MAPAHVRSDEGSGKAGGIRRAGDDALNLTVDYLKQETLEPLTGLGRFLAWGVAGSLAIAIGILLILLGILRLLQTETGTALTGDWSWVPYFVVEHARHRRRRRGRLAHHRRDGTDERKGSAGHERRQAPGGRHLQHGREQLMPRPGTDGRRITRAGSGVRLLPGVRGGGGHGPRLGHPGHRHRRRSGSGHHHGGLPGRTA